MPRPPRVKNGHRQNLFLSDRSRALLRILADRDELTYSQKVAWLLEADAKTKRIPENLIEREIAANHE